MPEIVSLPLRGNAIQYDAETATEVANLLDDLARGQGVAIDDAQDSETKARSRAKAMREAVSKLDDGFDIDRIRTHVIANDDDTQYTPVLSLKAGE